MDVSPFCFATRPRRSRFDDRSEGRVVRGSRRCTLRMFAPDREAYPRGAPSHYLPSNEAYNLAHHWTTGRCAPERNAPAYVGSGSHATRSLDCVVPSTLVREAPVVGLQCSISLPDRY